MTSPSQPPPDEQDGNLGVILAALVAALIAGAAVAVFVALLLRLSRMHVEALRYLLRPTGELRAIIVAPRPDPASWTEAQAHQHNQNLRRRASYLVNAGRRMSRAYRADGAAGLRRAYEAETRYWRQHQQATARRDEAARQVGLQARRWGDGPTSARLLGWHAVMDERTSAECRQAHGRNFDPSRIPPIGYPGSAHPHCRCEPGAPFATRRRVETIRPDPRAWAA